MNRMKTACVLFGNGCPRSFMEACRVIKFLNVNGWEITPIINKANLVFFYGCGVNFDEEQKGLKLLQLANKLKKKKSSIIACGCLPEINKNIDSNGLCAHRITSRHIERIDEIVGPDISIKNIREPNDLTPYQFIRKWRRYYAIGFLLRDLLKPIINKDIDNFKFLLQKIWYLINNDKKTLFHLRTSSGCLSECSYCAIRHTTGPLVSKSLERIITEFHEGLSKGYYRFLLVGEDVGAYGQDIGLSIVELLNSLFKIDKKYKIEIHDFSPKWLTEYFPSLYQIVKNNHDRIDVLGFPIQSGSEKILKLMNRDYSATELKRCLKSLREISPDVKLWTHVMIGFPGEDKNDFDDTMNLLDSIKFDHVSIYKYSDRPGTKSSELNHKISDDLKDSRIRRLEKYLLKTKTFV